MWYKVKFRHLGEDLTRETSWIHLDHLLSWIANTPGCKLLHLEVIEEEQEAEQ